MASAAPQRFRCCRFRKHLPLKCDCSPFVGSGRLGFLMFHEGRSCAPSARSKARARPGSGSAGGSGWLDGKEARFRPDPWARRRIDQSPGAPARDAGRASREHPPRGTDGEAIALRCEPQDQGPRGQAGRIAVRAAALGDPDDRGWCPFSTGCAPHVRGARWCHRRCASRWLRPRRSACCWDIFLGFARSVSRCPASVCRAT